MNHIEAMKQAHDMSLDGEHFAARQLLLETIADLEKQEPVAWTDELEIISKGIKDAIEEGGGFWRSCTGCYETNEGYPPNGAYFSKVFKCYLGNGCDECGGIGAIWDDTDYEEMAEYMMQEDTHPQQKAEQEPVAFPRNVQEYDEDWIIDPAFLTRVKHSIDPETPYEFTPSEEQIETTLLALEVIPSALYTTPPQRKPLTNAEIRKWWASENGFEDCNMAKLDDFEQVIRAVEGKHGIKE